MMPKALGAGYLLAGGSEGPEVDMPAHAGEQDGADVKLQDEFAGPDQAGQFLGRHQFELDARLRRMFFGARSGLDKE